VVGLGFHDLSLPDLAGAAFKGRVEIVSSSDVGFDFHRIAPLLSTSCVFRGSR
jgi:hypothetical protein